MDNFTSLNNPHGVHPSQALERLLDKSVHYANGSWFCLITGCPTLFLSREIWRKHVDSYHDEYLDDLKAPVREMSTAGYNGGKAKLTAAII